MVKIKIDLEKVAHIILVLTGLFGLFVAYQMVRYLLGGSWGKEDIIISLMGVNISLTFATAIYVATMKGENKYISYRLKSLDSAFRTHIKETNK